MHARTRQERSADCDETAIVDEAIASRRSVRAFLPDPVDEATIRDILEVAARAPSGTNMQPWRVYVTTGETKQRIADAILNSGIRAEKAEWDEYKYYPDQFFEPYLRRRRAGRLRLYGPLGIGRRDVDQMRAQHDRNFVFFDAPVGMIFTIDRRLNQGSWVDYGMFLQNIMVAARARGLHTCPQAAFAPYHHQIRPVLGISPTRRSSSAAWRSATRTRPSRRTTCAPSARRSRVGDVRERRMAGSRQVGLTFSRTELRWPHAPSSDLAHATGAVRPRNSV